MDFSETKKSKCLSMHSDKVKDVNYRKYKIIEMKSVFKFDKIKTNTTYMG